MATFCNDIIIDPATRDMLATDSNGGRIFRVPSANVLAPNSAQVWLAAPELAAPAGGGYGANGLDFVAGARISGVRAPRSTENGFFASIALTDRAFLGTEEGLRLARSLPDVAWWWSTRRIGCTSGQRQPARSVVVAIRDIIVIIVIAVRDIALIGIVATIGIVAVIGTVAVIAFGLWVRVDVGCGRWGAVAGGFRIARRRFARCGLRPDDDPLAARAERARHDDQREPREPPAETSCRVRTHGLLPGPRRRRRG